jgi:protein involved in polysaccharide export with SLBB domain
MKIKILFVVLFLGMQIFSQSLQNQLKQSQMSESVGFISVTIGGSFPVTGTFSALMTDRVDEFVSRMYTQATDLILKSYSDPDLIRKAQSELNNFSLRGIILKRSNGEKELVDLQKFRTTGDLKDNPYLKNDDVIIFPSNDIGTNFFSVSGIVNRPGIYYFVEGDRLSNAIDLAMGLNPAYKKIDSVEISRLSYDGNTQTIQMIPIADDILLQRGDRLRFVAQENQRRNFSVTVLGEVNSPGTIPITKSNTTLYEVVKLVGGFTEKASLNRSRVFKRSSLAMLLEQQYNISLGEQPDLENPRYRSTILNLEFALMYRMSNIYSEDTNYFNLENQLRVLTEGSSLDFNKISDPNSDISKYIVQSGDIIIVPPIDNSVYVFGQVLRPGHVTFIPGKDYQYYVNEANGLGELAEEGDIMVIKGGSRAWISPLSEHVEIEEGDYIYVPKKNLRTFRSYVAEYSIYVSILASVSALLLAVTNLVK